MRRMRKEPAIDRTASPCRPGWSILVSPAAHSPRLPHPAHRARPGRRAWRAEGALLKSLVQKLATTGTTLQALQVLSHGVCLRCRDWVPLAELWRPALAEAGLSATHFHDLRHTGNTLTAMTGASLRELMDRMGHSSARAALIYLHGSDARARDRRWPEQAGRGRAARPCSGESQHGSAARSGT
jgi:hypothetical protein